MPGRIRTPLCIAAVLQSACLSAPSETGGECGTSDALRDDFEGAGGASRVWTPLYLPEYFEQVDGRLRFVPPLENVTVFLRSRAAFRMADGGSLRVDVATWPETLQTYVMLDGVTQDFSFVSRGTGMLDVSAPLGTTDQVPLADARALRFSRTGDVMHLEASPDGETWQDLVFEPWLDEPASLNLMVLARTDVSEIFELDAVNGDVDEGRWCSAADLEAPFDDPQATVFTWVVPPCWAVTDGRLLLPASCRATTAAAYAFGGAGVEAQVSPGEVPGELSLAAVLADDTRRSVVWTPTGARLEAPGGIIATSERPSDRVRLAYRDGAVHAQQRHDGAWEEVGAIAVDKALVNAVQFEVSASGADIEIEELRGSPE